tara:strand:+ start:191 stop:505 length:315 start_codon:yes stop_codon:yes gene_type:complete
VAIPIPLTPKAGINIKPKIKIGFNIIFKKKEKINAFLKVFVSPSACNNELSATTIIKIIVPEKITLVYSNPNNVTSLVEPINKKTVSEKYNPKKVIMIEMNTPK